MRFAITGIDRSISVFDALIEAGWEPVKLFTMPVDDCNDHHVNIVNRANQLKVPVQLSRLQDEDLRQLGALRCDVLVVASYNWKIGDWSPYLPHAINFHPSLLPEARGPYPMIQAILRDEKNWGVTCHKLSPQFDQGDILAQQAFPLSADESHESINLKLQMASRRLATRVAGNFTELWNAALAQGPGSYWKMPGEVERTLDFTESVETILRQVRACGLFECKATVNGTAIFVRRTVGWTEVHHHTPGTVVHVQHRSMVVAVRDGYVGLIEWSSVAPGGQRNVGR